MKCPNCGEENPEGMKFCGNCGTKLPEPKNHCPHCNKDWPLTMKFCGECGFKFDGNGAAKSAGISMGDKNVIAGDVIGSKDETHVSGNATIIKNEDETKKTATCHVCGKNILKINGYTCPVCGQFTCPDCYVTEAGKCIFCRENAGNQKEEVYKQAVQRVLEDGKIDINERQELASLQKQLGLSITRASELEDLVKSEKNLKNTRQLGTFDKLNFEKAKKELYDELNYDEALKILEPLYTKNPNNEEILTDYLFALSNINSQKAREVIKTIRADVLCLYLTQIDFAAKEKNYSQMEEYILMAERLWPNALLLKCRKVDFNIALSQISGDDKYLNIAKEIIYSCKKSENKLERTWLLKTQRNIEKALKNEVPEATEEYCTNENVYKGFFIEHKVEYTIVTSQSQEKNELQTNSPASSYSSDKPSQAPIKELITCPNCGEINQDGTLWCTSCGNKLVDVAPEGVTQKPQEVKEPPKATTASSDSSVKSSQAPIKELITCPNCGEINQDGTLWCTSCGNKLVREDITISLESFNASRKNEADVIANRIAMAGGKTRRESNASFDMSNKENDTAKSLYEKGYNYLYGEGGVNPDYNKAVESFTQAAKLGNADAMFKLGYYYEYYDRNYNKAIEWYIKAAQQGNTDAQVTLGHLYISGKEVNEDYKKAIEWYRKAAEQGSPGGQYWLGWCYEIGKGVNIDKTKAIEWYRKAAEQGTQSAIDKLKKLNNKS